MRNIRLGARIFILGAGGALITAVALVMLAVWQSGEYNHLAQREVDTLINANLDHITQEVYSFLQTENEAVQEHTSHDIDVAWHLLGHAGEASLSDEPTTWTAINQLSGEQKELRIPKLMLGGQSLSRNADIASPDSLVDEVTHLTGNTATLFQRMNEKGDMLRVATTVKDAQGKRAVGTYIPAIHPDGAPDPVISAILKGGRYRGRAFVVDKWYLTAYDPLRDKAGNLIGMLYVGIALKKLEERVRRAIMQTRIGKTGYVYVIVGTGVKQGHFVISHQGARDDEKVWEAKDSDGRHVIQAIIRKALTLKPRELATERYRWRNPGEPGPRWKVARIAYFEPWDWVIGVSAYEDEIQHYHAVLRAGRSRMTIIMGGAGMAITLLIAMLGVLFTQRILRPVQQMTKAAEKVIQGDLDPVVEVHSHDEIGALASTFNFMTARLKQTMEGLRRSEEKYRQAQKMESVGLLAGGIAHDFNNLLQAILGHTSLAMHQVAGNAPLAEHLTQIDAAGERAARLVRQLLAFSRQQEMKVEILDLNERIGDLLKMLRSVIGENITLDFSPGAVGLVQADGGMVDQALINLCVNARDAMGEGGRLLLQTSNATLDEQFCKPYSWAKPGRYVQLTVSDTGCGMNSEVISHIFEPFFTTKGIGRGTGLGLATVYGIVKQHHGIIEVQSEPGQGAAFNLFFPLAEAAGVSVENLPQGGLAQGHETILLAEDDAMVRDLGRMTLERAGYKVLLAVDGCEAVAVFREHAASIDLVVMDIVMPNMGGISAFARIRELNPSVLVIFASGYNEFTGDEGLFADLNVRLIKKPIRPEAFLQEVRSALDC